MTRNRYPIGGSRIDDREIACFGSSALFVAALFGF